VAAVGRRSQLRLVRPAGLAGLVERHALKENPSMGRRVILTLMTAACLTVAVPTALAGSRWPSRATPLSSTLGWFRAINAHDRKRLLFYVATSAQDQMGWATPSTAWSKFTNLRCQTRRTSGSSSADVRCTFHESAEPTDADTVSFWDIYLRRTHSDWLIDSYGQG
jgi:hypothetical protein